MLNRFGFALTILLFGSLLFGIGYLWHSDAPDTASSAPVQNSKTKQPPEEDAPQPTALDSQEDTKNVDAEQPALRDLLPGAATPIKQRYTLMLGQFTSSTLAGHYAEKIGQPNTNIIRVSDASSMDWWLVTSGNYSLNEATKAVYELKALYGRHGTVIKLPAKPQS